MTLTTIIMLIVLALIALVAIILEIHSQRQQQIRIATALREVSSGLRDLNTTGREIAAAIYESRTEEKP